MMPPHVFWQLGVLKEVLGSAGTAHEFRVPAIVLTREFEKFVCPRGIKPSLAAGRLECRLEPQDVPRNIFGRLGGTIEKALGGTNREHATIWAQVAPIDSRRTRVKAGLRLEREVGARLERQSSCDEDHWTKPLERMQRIWSGLRDLERQYLAHVAEQSR